MRVKGLILGLIVLVFNSACTLKLGGDTRTVSEGWQPSDVRIRCGQNERCPSHQGILFGYAPAGNHQLLVESCTASLYGPDRVITAGHCQMAGKSQVFFLPVPKPGLPSQLVTAQWLGGTDAGYAHDYGAFQLDQRLNGREYVHPAAKVDADYANQTAFVVNLEAPEHYVLEAKECHNYPNKITATTVNKNPFYYIAQDCTLVKGNSGGILTPVNRWNEVLGLVSSGPNPLTSASEVQDRRNTYGLDDWTDVTNARCFELPGWPRVESNCGW